MDKRYIEENEIGLKYLKGQLTNEQLEQFEIYMMDNPDILDDLNLDQLMIKGSSVSHTAESPFKLSFIRSLFGDWRLVNSLASFALGLVAMAMFSIERVSVNSVEIQYLVAQDSVRGSDDSPVVEFEFLKASFQSSSQDQFVLVVEPNTIKKERFKVTISRLEKSEKTDMIVEVNGIITNSQGRVALTLRVNDFTPGEYLVELDSTSTKKSINTRFKTIQRG
jgi:hypothetical protein